jgi:molybdenum cofactor cytidylyltransferase
MARLAVLILAAGNSTRMGQSKQLLPIQGQPLLLRTAQTALSADIGPVYVVLGARSAEHALILKDLNLHIIQNYRWQTGIGSTVTVGLGEIIQQETPDGVMILVCDQPYLTAEQLQKLHALFQLHKNNIVASSYADTKGVPIIFPAPLFPLLLTLQPRQGAKKILQQYEDITLTIDFPEGAIDIDTPQDYLPFSSYPTP